MANTKKIKGQIKSVVNIKQITKALEIVATVKLQKIKQQTEQYRDFMIEFMRIVQTISNTTDIFAEPINGDKNTSDKELVIVLSSDKGLCGSLNSKLFKKIFNTYKDNKSQYNFFCIGKKALEFFSRSNFSIVGELSIKDNFTEDDLDILYTFIREAIAKQTYKKITIHFNYFKNAMQQNPVNIQLYPLEKDSFQEFTSELNIDIHSFMSKDIQNKELVLEPTPELLAKEIKKQLLQHMVYGALLHNKTGEFASRMIAMKSAKDNSTSLIKDLQLSFNKARQAVITQEISEIVGAKMAIE